MKRFLRSMIVGAAALILAACHVHQWPEEGDGPAAPGNGSLAIHLKFDTGFTVVDYPYPGETRSDAHTYSVDITSGTIRYVLHLYAYNADGTLGDTPYDISTLTYSVDNIATYDRDMTFGELAPGRYALMVWTQFAPTADGSWFYDYTDFRDICLQGEYAANTDYRDAFRGMVDVEVGAGRETDVTVPMTRPLGKYEFITTDLAEFLDKESTRRHLAAAGTRAMVEDYDVVFYYVGYMPSAYSIPQNRIVDSMTGVEYESSITPISQSEAVLGFDYVFANEDDTHVTLQIALFDKATGDRVSLTAPVRIPMMRSYHTVVRGSFLFKEAQGGVGVDPGFDGEFNIYVPMSRKSSRSEV